MAPKNSSSKLNLLKIDQQVISASKIGWAAACEKDTFKVEYEGFFDYLTQLSNQNNNQHYAITSGKSKDALAFVDIVSSANGTKTKLLKLIISPSISPKDEKALRELYLSAIGLTFSISNANKTKTVKFYGRTADMLELLVELNEIWNKTPLPDGLKSRMAGRWLEIYRG